MLKNKEPNKDKNKKHDIIQSWNGYDFRLVVPKVINKDNKIEVHFTFINPENNKPKQIKRSTGIDRNATVEVYTQQAKELIKALIQMLGNGYNFISNSQPENTKLTKTSSVSKCIDVWLKQRQSDFEAGKIQKEEIRATKTIFKMFLAHLEKNHQENEHPDVFTRNDIDRFMRIIEKDTMTYNPRFNVDGTIKDKVIPLSPVSYNLYLSRLAFFYDFLVIERVCIYNACKGAHRYSISNLKTRYTIFEDDELKTVRELLKTKPDYLDMLLSSHLLYSYRIRFKEQLKIRVGWIDYTTGILSLPERTIEHGKVVKTTKNGNSATFQLSERLLEMIKSYLGSNIKQPDFFLFGGKNESGAWQKSNSYFSKKWETFRDENNLSKHLKFYALKHTSNYNSFEQIGIEGLSQINRHSKISQTQTYIKSKLSKKTITINSENEF